MKSAAKQFPAGMEPLGTGSFTFACHPGMSCYTRCCRNVDMFLYPYDILLLKRHVKMHSAEFLQRHVVIVQGQNSYFPALMMKLTDDEGKRCPFLGENGCQAYENRPSSCRMYPLERAVDRSPDQGRPEEFYFLTNHPYCMGHRENKKWTVREWLRDQQLLYYNLMDDQWTEMDTLFASNPFAGEGVGGPKQQLAFMVCYNVDGFRQYIHQHQLLDRFKLEGSRKGDILRQDEELLKFGYDWLKFILAGIPTLRLRK
jgi:Fe-S-cluster containining protein